MMILILAALLQQDPEYIEVHTHLVGDFEAASDAAVAAMKKLGIRKCILMPPPFADEKQRMYDHEAFAAVLKRHPGKFAVLGGGKILNFMIHRGGEVTDAVRRDFEKKANEIIDAGAVGFGEMAVLHFSFFEGHPFEETAADHPLFLLLADVAAKRDVPIDLHMEPVEKDIPKMAKENIAGFERLLRHNRKARIVWAHVGWEHTGHGTVDLHRRLLKAHQNLYMSLKVHQHSTEATRPLAGSKLKEEWRALICEFPDRFVLGADQFYGTAPGKTRPFPVSDAASRDILRGLPADVAKSVATSNAERIYKLR